MITLEFELQGEVGDDLFYSCDLPEGFKLPKRILGVMEFEGKKTIPVLLLIEEKANEKPF